MRLRDSSMILPALENSLSDGTDVAVTDKYFSAIPRFVLVPDE